MGGVIEGTEEVQFTETGARPDTLEQTVVGAAETSAAVAPSGAISCGDKVWGAYKNLCSTLCNERPPVDECYSQIVPQFLQLTYRRDNPHWRAVFSLGQLSPEDLIDCLKSTYGDYITETDVAAQIRNGMQQGSPPAEVMTLFPELQALSQLSAGGYYLGVGTGSSNTATLTLSNPYLLVLCANPQYRPFLSGCVELAEKEGAFAGVDFDAKVDVPKTNHEKEKLGKYIVKYAQQIKHKDIIPIMKELQRIPVKS